MKILRLTFQIPSNYRAACHCLFCSIVDDGRRDKRYALCLLPVHGTDNISAYKNNLILWSNNSNQTFLYLNTETNKASTLFVPQGRVKNLKVCGDKLVYILGTSSVYSHDIASGAKKHLYTGTSVEGAVLSGDTLYVAKALVGQTDSSFVRVNTRTKETVPLLKNAFSSVALAGDVSSPSNHIFAIALFDENNAKSAQVFDYDPAKIGRASCRERV